tara:strand:+ start:1265 stop:2140 length:876 start_codon:yes stop_codon:yes gene_type:complete
MRYQEAFEIIDASLEGSGLSFPVSEKLKNTFFDSQVENIGLRVVKKTAFESFTSDGGREYIFTNANASDAIYKVQIGTKVVPFTPETASVEDIDDSNISVIGYYIKTDVANGTITGATTANPIVITSASHGLGSNDYVYISEISGLLSSSGALSEVNGIRHQITKINDNSFSIDTDGSGYSVSYSSGGVWVEDTKKLHFTKNPDSGGSIKVYYFAKPEERNKITSRVDLPDMLIPSAIHYTIAHILDLGSMFQPASSHRGIARGIEEEYLFTSRSRQAQQDIIPLPLQDFI